MTSSTIERLARDTRSSSAAIVKVAAQELGRLAEKASREELRKTCALLRESHPSMGALIRLCKGLEEKLAVTAPSDELVYFPSAFGELFSRHLEQTAVHGASVVPQEGVVVTYSASGSVGSALVSAFESGKRFRVIVSEGRPMGEGVDMARRLAETGIKVTTCTDLALGNKIGDANVVMVGCDAITKDGVVNKTGTRSIALLAKMQNIPCVCIATSEKILSDDALETFKILAHPGSEIAKNLPSSIEIENYYFDVTPLEFFSSIILEDGPTSPSKLNV